MMEPSRSPYHRPSVDELPSARRRLSTHQVLALQWKHINKSNVKDVWSFLYGNHMIAGCSALMSLGMLIKLRKPFKLGGLGLIVSLFPAIGLPYGASILTQSLLIEKAILTGQVTRCVECTQTRAMCYQFIAGCFYPLFISPLLTVGAVKKFRTAPLPPFYPFSEFKTNVAKLMRPSKGVWLSGTIVQIALTFYIVRKQQESFVWLMNQESNLVQTR